MSMFMKGWKLRADLAQNDGEDPDKTLTSFECTDDRRVGASIEASAAKSISYWDVTNDSLLVDPGTWAQSGGRPLVLAKRPSKPEDEEHLLWVERRELVDPTYATTLKTIDAMVAGQEAEFRDAYWPQRKAGIQAMAKISLPDDAQGVVGGSKSIVTVPKGTYKKLRVRDGVLFDPSVPFFVVIEVPKMGDVAIAPAALEGAETTDSDKAQASGLAVSVSAATIMETFAASPLIRGYVPNRVWLTDQQIHYVTPDEMGAAHVLERMPSGPEERTAAKTRDNDTFVNGTFVPGLRLGDDILVQLTGRGTGVEYHEALHRLSHQTFRGTFGRWFNEGVTEYFTRLAIAGLAERKALVRTDSPYEAQRTAAATLVKTHVVTDTELGEAYFGGNLVPLYAGFHRATGGELNLAAFAERLNPPNASTAAAVLEDAADKHAWTSS